MCSTLKTPCNLHIERRWGGGRCPLSPESGPFLVSCLVAAREMDTGTFRRTTCCKDTGVGDGLAECVPSLTDQKEQPELSEEASSAVSCCSCSTRLQQLTGKHYYSFCSIKLTNYACYAFIITGLIYYIYVFFCLTSWNECMNVKCSWPT